MKWFVTRFFGWAYPTLTRDTTVNALKGSSSTFSDVGFTTVTNTGIHHVVINLTVAIVVQPVTHFISGEDFIRTRDIDIVLADRLSSPTLTNPCVLPVAGVTRLPA